MFFFITMVFVILIRALPTYFRVWSRDLCIDRFYANAKEVDCLAEAKEKCNRCVTITDLHCKDLGVCITQ